MNATAGRLLKKPSITVGFHGLRMQAVFRPSTVRLLETWWSKYTLHTLELVLPDECVVKAIGGMMDA
jgi:hypothetical protein